MASRGSSTTGSIRERRPGVWELRIGAGRDPATGRYRQLHRTVHGTERQARRELANLVGVADEPQRPKSTATLGSLLDQWLSNVEGDLSPTTVREYRRLVERRIKPGLGTRPLARVGVVELEDLYRALTRCGLGAGSVHQVHAIIRRALGEAVRWGWLSVNPAASARPPRRHKAEIVSPEPEALLRLLSAADHRDLELGRFLRVAASTGARRGELCALRWTDVDLERGEVLIARALIEVPGSRPVEKDTKTHAKRRIAIGPTTAAVLRSQHELAQERAAVAGERIGPGAFVFASTPDGAAPWRPDYVTRAFGTTAQAAGVRCRLHDLRHFNATLLLAAGHDVGTVADRLGHRDASVTLNTYRHHVPAAGRAAGAFIDEILAAEPVLSLARPC